MEPRAQLVTGIVRLYLAHLGEMIELSHRTRGLSTMSVIKLIGTASRIEHVLATARGALATVDEDSEARIIL